MGEAIKQGSDEGEVGTTIVRRKVRHHRHGPKDETYKTEALTEEGKEHVRGEAERFFEYILSLSEGSVVSLVSSDIIRAQQTKGIFIEEIMRLARENAAHGVVILRRFDSKGNERSEEFLRKKVRDTRLRYVIVDEPDDADLGYKRDGRDNRKEFDETTAFFGHEEYSSFIHSAHPEEWPELAHDLFFKVRAQRVAEIGRELTFQEDMELLHEVVEKSDPRPFLKYTPEELVIHQLEAFQRNLSRMDKTFAGRETLSVFFGHAPGCDYVAMALFGEEISYENYKKIGGYRQYLEGLSFDIDDDGNVVAVDFRQKRELDPAFQIKLDDVIERLQQQAERRRAQWTQMTSQAVFISILVGLSVRSPLLKQAA